MSADSRSGADPSEPGLATDAAADLSRTEAGNGALSSGALPSGALSCLGGAQLGDAVGGVALAVVLSVVLCAGAGEGKAA